MSLTSEGTRLYVHAQRIRAELELVDASLPSGNGPLRGVLRMTVPDAFGRHVLLPHVLAFQSEWPELQVEMRFSDTIDPLVESGFDLAIRLPLTTPDYGLTSRTLTTMPVRLCAAPRYLAARGRPSRVEHLTTHDVLLFASGVHHQPWMLPLPDGSSERVAGRSRLRLNSAEALRAAAVAGCGIAFLPQFLVANDLALGRLERILPDVETPGVKVVALYPHKSLMAPRTRRFLDFIIGERLRDVRPASSVH